MKNGQKHCKRQQARLRRLVVDENAQQHRPYSVAQEVVGSIPTWGATLFLSYLI